MALLVQCRHWNVAFKRIAGAQSAHSFLVADPHLHVHAWQVQAAHPVHHTAVIWWHESQRPLCDQGNWRPGAASASGSFGNAWLELLLPGASIARQGLGARPVSLWGLPAQAARSVALGVPASRARFNSRPPM